MKKSLKTLKLEYQEFIDNIDIYLQYWKDKLCIKDLVFTAEEINKIQKIYMNHIEDEDVEKFFIAYCGTSFIKHNGGEWHLSTLKSSRCAKSPDFAQN